MNFFNLWGFIGLISLPIIVILYTVKQKSRIQQVSSLYLWSKIKEDKSGTSFFKKLKNNIFLFLNLLSALLLVLALTEPYINRFVTQGDIIIVVDNSLTMQAQDNEPTRLEQAKKQARQIIENKEPKQLVSIITMNASPSIIASRQESKSLLNNAINSIDKTFGGCDSKKTMAMIDSLMSENTHVYILSDDKMAIDGSDSGQTSFINLSKTTENAAITTLSHKVNNNGGVSIFAVAENFGENPIEKTVSIFADNKIIDTFTLTIQPNSRTQALAETDFIPTEIVANISPNDSLPIDDVRYSTVAEDSIKKVLLISKGNIFLEKALNAQPDVELYKGDTYSGATGYDYYIFDGISVNEYPSDGNLILFDIGENDMFKSTAEKDVSGQLSATGRGNYISDIAFSVLKSRGIENGGTATLEPMLIEDERTLMAHGSLQNGNKIFVCGFDLHNSDLPLKMDFPILIYNILNDFDNNAAHNADGVIAGTKTKLSLKADTTTAEIIDPEGKKSSLNIDNCVFTPNECGIYTIIENNHITGKIAANCAVEKKITGTISQSDEQLRVNYKLRKTIIILLMCILLVEIVLYFIRVKLDKRVIALRLAIFILLGCCITDFSYVSKTTDADTIFVLDKSESMSGNSDTAIKFINSAMSGRNNGDFTALMAFGNNASVESGLTNIKNNYQSSAVINSNQTNIENAVNVASALFTNERGKHIVLLTDGKETVGDAINLRNAGGDTVIDVVDFSTSIENEAQISKLRLPSKINKNTNYDITIQIDSLNKQQCGVSLFKNDKIIYQESLTIEKGENRFVVQDYADDTENVTYKCVIEPEIDTYTENNTLYNHTNIQDRASVLILEQNGSGTNLYNLISNFGVNAKKADMATFARHSESLGENDLVIIADCPVDIMTDEFLTGLNSYIKNSAGGLIVMGGENSFALGNYKDTVMEDILPVEMEMKSEEVDGDVAFFMVSDRSGSMSSGEYGKSKITMTKEAMASAVTGLKPNDTVAVLSFDDRSEWIVKPQQVGKDADKIINKIAGISDGGGTSILPALEKAYNEIIKNNSVYKHIILMTDGQAETTGYDQLIENMKKNNITLSTIAVGSDSDTNLLERLAKQSGGRYYYTDEFSNLPNIFSREAKLAGRDYINSEPFYPEVADSGDSILKNADSIPMLGGYIATKGKGTANIVLTSKEGEPVIGYWQYGLGKTAVFTSDLQNFCGDWLSTDEGITILKNFVSSTMRRPMGLDGEITYTEVDEKGIISINFNDAKNITSLESGTINNKPLDFVQTSIGRYEAEVEPLEQGSYFVNVSVRDKNGLAVINDGVDISYSKEFDLNNQTNVLANIADNEAVTFITEPSQVFTQRTYSVNHTVVLYKWLLPLALLLFLAEIFLRRIGAVRIPEKKQKNKPIKQQIQLEQQMDTTQTLLSNKRQRKN